MANTVASFGANSAALVFESTTFDVADQKGQQWLKAADIASALGYSRSDKVTQLFDRNRKEFTDSMTTVVENLSSGASTNLVSQTRIFSLRGAHLLAMFARTAVSALFRKWVLDILDAQIELTRIALPSATITPAQAQHLRELVQLVVESGKQGHGESWNRLHRKMQVNSYLMLRPDQFDAACQYLGGKFDDTSIATLIQKHLPHAVAALPPKNAPQALPVNTSEMRLSELISAGNGIYIETDELHRIAAVCMDRLAGRANFHQARAMQLRMDSAS